jgi:Holliday junction DNA helicase RuvA
MIGYLQGTVVSTNGNTCILLTNSGVGYEVNYTEYLKANSKKELFISTVIKENSHSMFGFNSFEDKEFFEMLLNVNGVGPKSAYSLVSSIGTSELISAITLEQTAILKKAPGIGKKAAEQIILSMKDKVQKMSLSITGSPQMDANTTATPETNGEATLMDGEIIQETLLALESLGYKNDQVMPVLKKNFGAGLSSSELIKSVLREL